MYRQSEKHLLNNNTSSTCPDNMVNFGLLTADICWWVWGTPANFNGFRVLAALPHGTLVVGVSQTLRHWTDGATYIRQGDHHVLVSQCIIEINLNIPPWSQTMSENLLSKHHRTAATVRSFLTNNTWPWTNFLHQIWNCWSNKTFVTMRSIRRPIQCLHLWVNGICAKSFKFVHSKRLTQRCS